MQTKLHQWAAVDDGRRFGDVFNLVHDPATLQVAFERVAGNAGANTAGVDRTTVRQIRWPPAPPGRPPTHCSCGSTPPRWSIACSGCGG
jgi:RNA-directed DNA polymerase